MSRERKVLEEFIRSHVCIVIRDYSYIGYHSHSFKHTFLSIAYFRITGWNDGIWL